MPLKKIQIKQLKNTKSMTYDEMANWLQIATGVVITITFLVGIATVWVTLKANAERDAKTREAEKTISDLQEKVRFRVLSPEKRLILLKQLNLLPKGEIKVSYIVGNQEPEELARQLNDVFKEAGWTTELVGGMFAEIPKGIIIFTPTNAKQLAEMLAVTIDNVGLRPVIKIDDSQEKLHLLIGVKL